MARPLPQLIAAACACLSACTPSSPNTPRTSGPLPQQAYVWQQNWTPEVQNAVDLLSPQFNELVLLAGVINLNPKTTARTKIDIPWSSIPTNTQLSIALRIHSFQGPYSISKNPFLQLSSFVHELVTNTSPAHPLTSLHLDFDCPTSKLADYASWVHALQKQIHPLPITITALPSWIHHQAFKQLAHTAHQVVLQVHGLHLPSSPDAPFSLCDPAEASRAVENLSRLHTPFTVALPTYGYQLLFNASHQLVDVIAEESPSTNPDHLEIRETWTDPATITHLIQLWTHDRPASMTSIIWYRLPIETDQRNWSWPTLQSVMQGVPPTPQLELRAIRQPDASTTITLSNVGTADDRTPSMITAQWTNATPLAAESLPGFKIIHRTPTSVQWSRTTTNPLRPNETTPVGWITTSPPTTPALHLQ
jgi:hypothetical protein